VYGEMEMNRFKSAMGLIILVLGVGAAIGNIILQSKFDYWKSLPDSYLNYVGVDMYVLVAIIYMLSLAFVFAGIYIMYEAGVFVE
jgi:hypothetical protein